MPGSFPPPAYVSDARLSELSTGELLVTLSLRLWVASRCEPAGARTPWQQGFERARLDPAGAVGFDTLLRIVAVTATRALDFRRLHSARLGEDEGRILRLTALLQRNRLREAAALFAGMLPPAAARMASEPATAFAGALASGGLWIPWRICQGNAYPAVPRAIQTAPASSRVH